MQQQQLLQASSRVAFAALMHDIGKLAERARLPISEEEKQANKHLYCPFNKKAGYHSHIHAAYTGIALTEIEALLPPMIGEDVFPFADWKSRGADDSMINAAAMHHKPHSFLQWIVASADRIASGFERDEFDSYNLAQEENHYRSRLLSQFNQIVLSNKPKPSETDHRYPLGALSIDTLFPLPSEQVIPSDNQSAQQQYRALWNSFVSGLQSIPTSHRSRFDLWLDHFDSLWQTTAHSIPSATAFGTKPDVSLYDHSKTAAALACALWRYHYEEGEPELSELSNRADWDRNKLLLVQGDFFGVQSFIFASGSQTNKGAAKLLRGRSFYVSLLAECAALKVLEALALPSTSMVLNAAGKFMIVAPNTEATRSKLGLLQAELNQWFLEHSYGESGIGLAWQESCCNDFVSKKQGQDSRFSLVIKDLFATSEANKFQRFNLCAKDAPSIFEQYLATFDSELGTCSLDSRLPANVVDNNGNPVNQFSLDQLDAGRYLANPQLSRLLISEAPVKNSTSLSEAIFGYYIHFTADEQSSGKFSSLVSDGVIRRALDLSLPTTEQSKPLFNGYATRHINAYVPTFDGNINSDQILWEQDKYAGLELFDEQGLQIKTLEHIACEDRTLDPNTHKFTGIRALQCLKGDIDNLGAIFESGLQQPTFAKLASLSRRVNLFFATYLPYLCQQRYPNCYTIFAGGDDFFLIGPWHSTFKLASELEDHFKSYVGQNPDIHFSVGLSQVKAGVPIRYMSEQAEQALDYAKKEPKNAVNVYGETVSWPDFKELLVTSSQLDHLRQELSLSTGYLYGLIELCEMAALADKQPEAARWRSYLSYRTARMVSDKLARKEGEEKSVHNERCRRLTNELLQLVGNCIAKHKGAAKIAIFSHLYQLRD